MKITNDILAEADRIINGERQEQYGKAEDNFDLIAQYWEIYLDNKNNDGNYRITTQDVATMQMLLKIARTQGGQAKRDNYVDIAGYAALAARCAGVYINTKESWEEALATVIKKANDEMEKTIGSAAHFTGKPDVKENTPIHPELEFIWPACSDSIVIKTDPITGITWQKFPNTPHTTQHKKESYNSTSMVEKEQVVFDAAVQLDAKREGRPWGFKHIAPMVDLKRSTTFFYLDRLVKYGFIERYRGDHQHSYTYKLIGNKKAHMLKQEHDKLFISNPKLESIYHKMVALKLKEKPMLFTAIRRALNLKRGNLSNYIYRLSALNLIEKQKVPGKALYTYRLK